ncbi:MAG: hypothetical protein WCL02_04995 [bacterium]
MKKITLTVNEMMIFIDMVNIYKIISSKSVEKQMIKLRLKAQFKTLEEENCVIDVPETDIECFQDDLTDMGNLFILDESHTELIEKMKKELM